MALLGRDLDVEAGVAEAALAALWRERLVGEGEGEGEEIR